MVNQLPVPLFKAHLREARLQTIFAPIESSIGRAGATLVALAADPIIYGMSQDLMLLCPGGHPDPAMQHALRLCHLVQVAGGCAAASTDENGILNALVDVATLGHEHEPADYATQIRALCQRIDPLSEWLMYQTWHAAVAAPPSPELLDTALTMVGDAHAKLDTATCIIATFDTPTSIVMHHDPYRVQIGSLAFRVVHASVWVVGGASMHISWDADGRKSTPSRHDLDLANVTHLVDQHTRLDGLYRVVLQRVHE